jgi:hypothetical protein
MNTPTITETFQYNIEQNRWTSPLSVNLFFGFASSNIDNHEGFRESIYPSFMFFVNSQ